MDSWQVSGVRSGEKSEYAKDKPSTSKLQPLSTYTKAKSSLPIQRSASYVVDRKKIKNFIKTFKLVKPALEKVIQNNKNEKEVAKEYKFKVRSEYYRLFKETVKIVKDRKNYYYIKDNINKDFQAVSSGDMDLFTIARKYDINNYVNLFEQYKKYEKTKPSNKYVYDRYTFFGTFKYDQLRSIRRKFIKWSKNENKDKDFCSCRTCALEHLLDEVNASNIKISLPYLLGPQTKNYFKEWFQEVNIMFSVYPNNFPIKRCKKDQPQPSSSRTERSLEPLPKKPRVD